MGQIYTTVEEALKKEGLLEAVGYGINGDTVIHIREYQLFKNVVQNVHVRSLRSLSVSVLYSHTANGY